LYATFAEKEKSVRSMTEENQDKIETFSRRIFGVSVNVPNV
jgi:hypothetical protein